MNTFSDSFRGYCAGYNFAFIDNNEYTYLGRNTEQRREASHEPEFICSWNLLVFISGLLKHVDMVCNSKYLLKVGQNGWPASSNLYSTRAPFKSLASRNI